ncbi:MAG: DUF4159 domain-containing protein [Nanoarchaeota archaeon]|nr:DUF4159 domain-containing protein [Nanoarchaeota archaeon]
MKNINRRNFLELVSGLATLPSLASSAELKGFAIQDPTNKQNVRGFVHIPSICGEQLKPNNYQLDSSDYRIIYNNDSSLRRANIGLIESIKKYTNLNAFSDKPLFLSSKHLIQYPFIYVTTDNAFELTKTEKENFNNYLRNGGFAVLESLEPQLNYSQAEASLKQMIKDTLKNDARFLPIPNSHNLYHCFFNFDMPPQGTEVNYVFSAVRTGVAAYFAPADLVTLPKPRPYLEGIFLEDRLAVVYSGKGYGKKWKDISNNEPQQKMAVNFVVYALTQKGGIAQKNN